MTKQETGLFYFRQTAQLLQKVRCVSDEPADWLRN